MVLSIKEMVVNEKTVVPAVKKICPRIFVQEIVGIARIDGNGVSLLILAITGLRKVESGSIELKGDSIVGLHPRHITELSVGHVYQKTVTVMAWFWKMISENIALQTYYKKNHIVKMEFWIIQILLLMLKSWWKSEMFALPVN